MHLTTENVICACTCKYFFGGWGWAIACLLTKSDFFFYVLGIKDYSSWPTIPQVYFQGEFLGGCDIMLEMHQSGDLIDELTKVGIKSALLDGQKDGT